MNAEESRKARETLRHSFEEDIYIFARTQSLSDMNRVRESPRHN